MRQILKGIVITLIFCSTACSKPDDGTKKHNCGCISQCNCKEMNQNQVPCGCGSTCGCS